MVLLLSKSVLCFSLSCTHIIQSLNIIWSGSIYSSDLLASPAEVALGCASAPDAAPRSTGLPLAGGKRKGCHAGRRAATASCRDRGLDTGTRRNWIGMKSFAPLFVPLFVRAVGMNRSHAN